MSDTSLVFNLVARDQASETLTRVRERFETTAAGIGTGVAAALGVGVAASLDMEAANAKLAAQLGVGPEKAAELSKVSASVYAGAWGDSAQTVNDAIRGVYQNIGDTAQAKGGLEGLTTKALALSQTFDQEVGPTTAAVGQMLRTGLAKNADEAFDILTRGFQTGANKADDLLDTVNEYGTQWRKFGLDGKTAMGLLSQGLKAGARDADIVADAVKEFSIRAIDGSKSTAAGFQAIGLDAAEMAAKIGKGGSSATSALDLTLDRLRGIKDPVKQSAAAVQLFGTQSEDLGKALYSLDPSAAVSALGKVDGAMDKTAKTISSSPQAALESFKRESVQKLGAVAGTFIQFATKNQAVFEPLAYTLMGLAATVLFVKGAMITYSAVSAVVSGAHAIMTASTWGVIGGWLRMNAVGLMAYARIGVSAVASALTTAAAWTGSALVSIGTWIASVVRAAVVSAAQFVMMAARAVAWAAVMAAQWLIAMGPIGWIIAAVIGLALLIYANWDRIKGWTLAAWEWVVGKLIWAKDMMIAAFMNFTLIGLLIKHWSTIKSTAAAAWNGLVAWLRRVPGMIYNAFLNFTPIGLMIKHWSRIKTVAITKAQELVAWMRGLPGRISAGIGSLGSLLTEKGRNVVQGLWNGIKSMGGWIRGQITGWAKSTIPGPIAKALGIASPSKVTTAQGRWIARGLVAGLTGSAKQVRSASTKLADIVRDSLAPGKRRTKALGKIGSGTKDLITLANREASLAARMKKASKSLADQIKARDKLAADVRKGILDAANITTNSAGGPVTADSILTQLRDRLGQARKFAADLAALRKKGVRSDLIAQIAQAGAEQGGAAAAALAGADKGVIKQINSTQSSLVAAASQAGSVAGNAMYGAGINAAQGLVKGLAAQQKAIEKQMLRIARGMRDSLKRALGIRSPSTLMAEQIGRWIPPGVVEGMQRTAPQLDQAMSTLVRPELATPPDKPLTAGMAPMIGAQAGGGLVRIRVETTGAENDVKKLLRKLVRVDGRGSVQILMG